MALKALILIDFEKEWTNKNSDYFVGDISKIIKRTNKLIEFCRKNNYKIIFTKHVEKNSDKSFIEDSENVELIHEIHRENSDLIITKNKISPFFKTDLEKKTLKELRKLLFAEF